MIDCVRMMVIEEKEEYASLGEWFKSSAFEIMKGCKCWLVLPADESFVFYCSCIFLAQFGRLPYLDSIPLYL